MTLLFYFQISKCPYFGNGYKNAALCLIQLLQIFHII